MSSNYQPVPTVEFAANTDIVRAIDRFLPDADQIVAIDAVRTMAFNECLAEYDITGGLGYEDPDQVRLFAMRAVDARFQWSSLWGYWDPGGVVLYGYGVPEEAAMPLVQAGPESMTDEIAADCEKKASQAIGGHGSAFEFASTSVLPHGGPTTPVNDPDYQIAVSDWSTCMAASGYDMPDPVTSLNIALETGTENDVARARAVADVACKQSTDLIAKAATIQDRYDALYIAQYQQDLIVFRTMWEALIEQSPQHIHPS